jgi:RNA 3'-phosphate cyclase
MLEIDGSYLEGGGQIVRTSIALSALLRRPVRITDIRKGRPNPGLQLQHLTAAKALAQLCDARLQGAEKGSATLEFSPAALNGGSFVFDIGSAGSITLLLQALAPAAHFTALRAELHGGTAVQWSPTFWYAKHVLFATLSRLGYTCDLRLQRDGWYPKGGGIVMFETKGSSAALKPIVLEKRGALLRVAGVSAASNLPAHVAERQKASAEKALRNAGIAVSITAQTTRAACAGSALTLWAEYEHAILGASALGALGKSAETVGEEAAAALLQEMKSDAAVDAHLCDQLIPYMALAEGRSRIAASKITRHALTNIFVVEQFLPVKFRVSGAEGSSGSIEVDGVGFGKKE